MMLTARVTYRNVLLSSLIGASVTFAGCQFPLSSASSADQSAPISTEMKFSPQTFGVPASPRLTASKDVRKGGGRFHIGKPYKVRGKWYYPKEEPGYVATGRASWYGPNFHGRMTANGEVYDMYALSAAHTTFPLPSYAKVTNLKNGRSVQVRVNDRGPFAHDRIIDVSSKAAELLGFKKAGTATVKVEYIGRAPLEGDDTQMLMATFDPGNAGLAPGERIMVAANSREGAGVSSGLAAFASADTPPGVRPLAEIANSRVRTAWVGAPELSGLVPIPQARPALSYAATRRVSGAARAIGRLTAPDRDAETVSIGVLKDDDLIAAVRSIVGRYGLMREEVVRLGSENALSMSVEVEEPALSDELVRTLWSIGAKNAFVVRD